MSIPSKKYFVNDLLVPIDSFYNPTGSECSKGIEVVQRYTHQEYTQGVRQRVKPKKLLPTSLNYVDNYVGSDTSYACGPRPYAPGYASGGHDLFHQGEPYRGPLLHYDSNDLIEQSRLLAYNRLNEHGAQFGESFAELGQTAKMVARRIRQVAQLAHSLRRGDWKGLANQLKAGVPTGVKRLPPGKRLSNGWLELEFGWKPLLSDIHTAVDVYRNTLVEGSLNNTRGNSTPGGFGVKGGDRTSHMNRITNGGPNASTKLYATVGNANLATLNDLGLVNPALLGWQLLPFSFVVDWVLPVSSTLSSLTSQLGYKVEMECRTREAGHFRQFLCGDISQYNRTVYRTVHPPSTPSVPLRFNFRAKSLWHVGTATALLRQRFGR